MSTSQDPNSSLHITVIANTPPHRLPPLVRYRTVHRHSEAPYPPDSVALSKSMKSSISHVYTPPPHYVAFHLTSHFRQNSSCCKSSRFLRRCTDQAVSGMFAPFSLPASLSATHALSRNKIPNSYRKLNIVARAGVLCIKGVALCLLIELPGRRTQRFLRSQGTQE